jgi:hypothetical protein
MGMASKDFFSSSTAATVFGKSVRNESVGGSQGFETSFFTRFVRSCDEKLGARPVRICLSTLPAAAPEGGVRGVGAKPLARARNDKKSNLIMFFF